MSIDRGMRDGISYTMSTLIQGSWAFNVFTMVTKGYNYMRALIFGQAQYIGTERGYVLQNASMVVLYGLYVKSHLYQGLELLLYLLLFHTHTSLPKSWLYSWSVWMFTGSVVIAPWWFSPQATNLFWMQNSWMDWRRWIDGNFPHPKVSNGSWNNWHAHMISNWREMLSPWYKVGVVFTSGMGRIILALVCIASMHGATQIEGVPQISQFSVNALRMSVACFAMMASCVLYYIALRSKALVRGPWLAFPEQLWKLSVYRGIVRFMIVLMWLGFYAVFMYDAVEGVSSTRTLMMTLMGCVAIISCLMELWVMIGKRDIDHAFDFFDASAGSSGCGGALAANVAASLRQTSRALLPRVAGAAAKFRRLLVLRVGQDVRSHNLRLLVRHVPAPHRLHAGGAHLERDVQRRHGTKSAGAGVRNGHHRLMDGPHARVNRLPRAWCSRVYECMIEII